MKLRSKVRITRMKIATSLLVLSGLCGFASIAISAEDVSSNSNAVITDPQNEVSDGSVIALDGGLSIAPIPGWKIERKALGMGLVMKEILPEVKGSDVDYSKPVFARNITLMTLPESRFMDQRGIDEAKAEISKMIARDPSLKDFMITEAKAFDYRGQNDGIVIFSQLTVNNYQMMQMQILVSGDKKAYLLTYSDLASNFANPASYDAAWKSMTSIQVPGSAPKRFEREMILGGSVAAMVMFIFVPFFVTRWASARRLKKLAEELQYDWDHGAVKTDADYELSDIDSLEQTAPAKKMGRRSRSQSTHFDINVSSISSVSHISTRHSRFA